MPSESRRSSKTTSKKTATRSRHHGKWVYCYLPSVDGRVRIVGETRSHWIVDHPKEMVVKCACSTTPSTKIKAVRNPRGTNADDRTAT